MHLQGVMGPPPAAPEPIRPEQAAILDRPSSVQTVERSSSFQAVNFDNYSEADSLAPAMLSGPPAGHGYPAFTNGGPARTWYDSSKLLREIATNYNIGMQAVDNAAELCPASRTNPEPRGRQLSDHGHQAHLYKWNRDRERGGRAGLAQRGLSARF